MTEDKHGEIYEDEPLLMTGSSATLLRRIQQQSCLDQLWSKLVFGWFNSVVESIHMQLEAKQSPSIEDDDRIPPLPTEESSRFVASSFEKIWEEEKRRASEKLDNKSDGGTGHPRLTLAILKAFGPTFMKAMGLKLIFDSLQFVGPLVLNGLIEFLRTPSESIWDGVGLTLIVTAAQLMKAVCLRHAFFRVYRITIRIRSALLLAIYQKSLTIDSSYYVSHPVGKVTNLMSVDVQRLADITIYLQMAISSILLITMTLYFLFQQLGASCLAGVAIIVASIPLTGLTARWMGQIQKKLMILKDDRVQANQEIFSNMRIVKLQAWEGPFGEKVARLRQLELRQLFRYMLAQSCSWLLWGAVPLLIALFTFGAYVLIAGQVLDVASALTALALFDILRFPLFMLPLVTNMLVEAAISIKRVEEFLLAPDRIPPKEFQTSDNVSGSKKIVQVTDATFTYQDVHSIIADRKKNMPTEDKLLHVEQELLLMKARLADTEDHLAKLEGRSPSDYGSIGGQETANDAFGKLLSLRRLNFECFEGQFIAIVGGVGSGKSTFLKSLLGEVQKVSGDVAINGKVAYFDQTPFIMNDTLKGNILFGKPDDNDKLYKLALKSCSLEHDLTLLPGGDQCEVGERGITLSGGQKARIAMARVVYHDAEISLLDDCLSAVDAHVGRHLFNECIVDALLQKDSGKNSEGNKRKRTVILVTNALQYLSHPLLDTIVVLKDGAVVETGTYQELSNKNDSHFKSYLTSFKTSMAGDYRTDSSTDEELEEEEEDLEALVETTDSDPPTLRRRSSVENRRRSSTEPPIDADEKKKLMTDEMAERAVGKVSWDVYISYVKTAGGVWIALILLLIFSAGEAMKVLVKWWLTVWSNSASQDLESQIHYLSIYALIIGGTSIASFSRMASLVLFGLKASKSLFASVFANTLNAPMAFFDTTPIGRLMNRFSKDIYTLDEGLPMSLQKFGDCIFTVISTLCVVTWVTPIFSVVLIPILYFYRMQQARFTQCYRELKRIDSVARSPIYALFAETIDGPCTIRAFGAEGALFDRMSGMLDHQQHAFYLNQSGLCWLGMRLELISAIIIFSACMAAVWEKRFFPAGDEVFAGLAGLSISYALAVTASLNFAVRQGSEFEANMVSVERLRQYGEIPCEAARETEADKSLASDWPSKGEIEFRNVKLRYRPGLPLVLKDLNITIAPQSKVGIVGRTGAGKTTLMTALMRLVEIDSGGIFLDGVDARSLGLHRLRSSIAIIPQDPVLFSGTVKSNLDPFDHFENKQIKDVLERVGLWTNESASAVNSLEDDVAQNGSNFSVGQRQLLVIARALLDGARIVICDEATAAIDTEADARIQKVLRTDFAHATTLTVAHRLNTIMDSSHILVMSDGKAAEFDTPANLLAKGGLFKDLVDTWEEEHEA